MQLGRFLVAISVLLPIGASWAGDPAPPVAPPAAPGAPAPSASGSAPLEDAFLPKHELCVPEFLASHPEADGRGIVVAILDTGVDPGHPRLAKTSTGETKIADMLDATDDGIVDTTRLAEVVDGHVLGTTGRTLTLGAHVTPGKKAYLGRIDATDVLPPELLDRLRSRRRERLAEAVRRAKEGGAPATPARPDEPDAIRTARLAAESEARERLSDETPAFDVLVAERGSGYVVVVDTDGDGDLAEEKALRDYSVAQEWVTLKDDAELNVGVRPDADGRHVRLLFDGGGHGTHVAGIVAGYEAAGSPANGLAPGARILAIKVGNSHWGGPTTNFAIARALDWAGRRGAKVVNLSFGGPSFLGDSGTPDARVADEAVERYGLLCCFSAGNEGPALSTVGSPATARRVLSVGAYLAPPTMKVSYGQLGPDPGERMFGFSSRGPLAGGDLGVSILAPGAAWSTVPSWQLVRSENMNGTSMAAPQVSGAAAVLLSAALAAGVPAPPSRAVRAIRVGARPVAGLLPCEQGSGLFQVDRAFEALVRMKGAPEERELRARIVNPTGVGGGIYERNVDVRAPFDRAVSLSVVWPKAVGNDERTSFERHLEVKSDVPWIEVPPRVGLNADGGSFVVRVDARVLPGGLHQGLVSLTDPARAADGPELVIPVTVIRPADADSSGRYRASVPIDVGERVSRFVRVPAGASRARVRATLAEGPRDAITVALAALDSWRRQEERVTDHKSDLSAGESTERSLDLLPGTVLEITLFSHWNQNGHATVELDATFEGPCSPDSDLEAGPGEDIVLLRLASPLAPFVGRVDALVTDVVERPEVTRDVKVDEGGPLYGGDRLWVSTQRFSVRMARGETVRVVPLGTHALDEQREDARWRVIDEAGRVVKKEVIDGSFVLTDLPAGLYRVEYETPTLGRAAADTGLLGFELWRARDGASPTVYPTADLAAEQTGADAGLDLPQGSARSLAIRLPGLDAGKRYVGSVSVKDREGRTRLSLPLVVDRRIDAAETTPAAAKDALVLALTRRATVVAADPSASADDLAAASLLVAQALELRASDIDLELLALRLLVLPGRPPKEAKPADGAALSERVEKALARLDKGKAEDRPRLGRLLALRSTLRARAAKPTEAAADLAEARFLLPEGDADLRALRVAAGLEKGGDLLDALAVAKALRDDAPTDFARAALVVDVLLRLGWAGPAGAELRPWPDRFPLRSDELRVYATKVKAAGGDPAPRTLEALSAGAP